jgi:hypothetical protein
MTMSDKEVIERLVGLGMDRRRVEHAFLHGSLDEQTELRIVAALSTVLSGRRGVGLKTLLWLGRVVRTVLEGRP